MSGRIVTVDFRNDTLIAVERDDGVYVALRPICEALGIDWSSQLKRLRRDPVLSEAVVMMTTPFGRHGQEEACLRLDMLNGWLFTIDVGRVKEAVRPKIIEYQRECYGVLFSHFYGKATGTKPEPLGDEVESSDSEKLRKITEARHIFGTPAAAELWFKLGMPITPAMLKDPRQYAFDYAAIRVAEPPDKEQSAA